jgi:hypothetical protein
MVMMSWTDVAHDGSAGDRGMSHYGKIISSLTPLIPLIPGKT